MDSTDSDYSYEFSIGFASGYSVTLNPLTILRLILKTGLYFFNIKTSKIIIIFITLIIVTQI